MHGVLGSPDAVRIRLRKIKHNLRNSWGLPTQTKTMPTATQGLVTETRKRSLCLYLYIIANEYPAVYAKYKGGRLRNWRNSFCYMPPDRKTLHFFLCVHSINHGPTSFLVFSSEVVCVLSNNLVRNHCLRNWWVRFTGFFSRRRFHVTENQTNNNKKLG